MCVFVPTSLSSLPANLPLASTPSLPACSVFLPLFLSPSLCLSLSCVLEVSGFYPICRQCSNCFGWLGNNPLPCISLTQVCESVRVVSMCENVHFVCPFVRPSTGSVCKYLYVQTHCGECSSETCERASCLQYRFSLCYKPCTFFLRSLRAAVCELSVCVSFLHV